MFPLPQSEAPTMLALLRYRFEATIARLQWMQVAQAVHFLDQVL
jgi:hypothetical protein